MIAHWLHRDQSRQLILFCNGWGMDHHPLTALESGGYDVCVLYDYSTFEPPVDIGLLATRYERITLICWSFGVWAGALLFGGCREAFAGRIGVNGTLRPIDDRYGIPHRFFEETLSRYSVSVRDRFYRRMCRSEGVLDLFLERQPRRSVEDQKHELEQLCTMVGEEEPPESFFETVIIAGQDRIVPTAHQLSYWQGRSRIVRIEGCHYLFSGWRSWAQIASIQDCHG